MKNKISLTQLAAYFPHEVKALFRESNAKKCKKYVVGTVGAIYKDCSICCYDTVNATPDKYKLILKPLIYPFKNYPEDWLVQEHYDAFGLIVRGLAISEEEVKTILKVKK